MKRIFKYALFVLILSGFFSTEMEAKRISPDIAIQNSFDLFSNVKSSKKNISAYNGDQNITLIETISDSEGLPLLYVFSRGEKQGYVVTTADDVLTPVIAFSDKGTFKSMADFSPTMQAWLKAFSNDIASLYDSGEIDHITVSADAPTREPIDWFLEYWWGQSEPFNNKCPVIKGERTVAGCVAIANAMVLAHHKYPETGEGVKTITSSQYNITYDFGNVKFDHDNILPYYTNEIDGEYETQESHDAVAELVYAAAVAWGTQFGVEGSSSAISASPFSTYLKYPKEGLGKITREYFTIEEWEDIVYAELEAGRPVVYEGNDGTKGHAFVIDGYKDGFFHINWGWFGDSDDYFSLSYLRPGNSGIGGNTDSNYSFNQGIIRGLRRPDEAAASPLFTALNFSYDAEAQQFVLSNLSSKSGWSNVITGVCVEDKANGTVIAELATSPGSQVQKKDDENNTLTYFNVDFSAVPNGNYRLRPVIKLDGTEDNKGYEGWYKVYCTLKSTRYIDTEIANGEMSDSQSGSDVVYGITFTNFRTNAPIMNANAYKSFQMDVENNGNTFLTTINKRIYHAGTDELATSGTDTGREVVALEPGQKQTITLSINNNLKTAGEYELQIVDPVNPEITYSDRIPFTMLNYNASLKADGLNYVVISEKDATAILIGGSFGEEVVIPAEVQLNGKQYSVEMVGVNVANESSKIKKIIVSEGIKSVCASAFRGCKGLEEVSLPESLTFLGGNSFGNCTSLKKVNIPPLVTEIPINTFTTTALTEIEIPEGVTSIGKYAFSSAPLKKVTLPSTLKSIDLYAFAYNIINDLIVNAPTPPEITEFTFYKDSYRTTKLYVPEAYVDNYKKHEYWGKFSTLYGIPAETVFCVDGIWYSSNPDYEASIIKPQNGEKYTLTSLAIPGTVIYKDFPFKVVEIADEAFMGVESLTKVSGGVNLRKIGNHAFDGTNIMSSPLNDAVEEIGDYAFRNTDLGSFSRLPVNLKKIGKYAFAGNKRMNFYKNLNSPNNWLAFPTSLESIGDGAFEGCVDLNTLQISSDIDFGENVFNGCNSLRAIYLANTSVPIDAIKDIATSLTDPCFYIDKENRNFFEEAFDDEVPLYDLLTVKEIRWDNKPDVKGITDMTIEFDSKQGNPKPAVFIVKNAMFKDIASMVTKSCDDYPVTGCITVTMAPFVLGQGTPQITFEQPGLNEMFSINITEIANLIQDISLSEPSKSLKPHESYTLTATYSPQEVDNSELVWSSSDTKVATVDKNGKVTAVGNGNATITCKALMGLASAKCTVVVASELRPGKALDEEDPNAEISVADVNAIASYIMGETVENFNITNADANQDGKISVADVTTTVKMILNAVCDQPDSESVKAKSGSALESSSVVLSFDDINIDRPENTNAAVRLIADADYSSIQADIICPQGLAISDIQLAPELTGHTLAWTKINDNRYRVIIYSVMNDILPGREDEIATIKFITADARLGTLAIERGWAATPSAAKKSVISRGGTVSGTSGIVGLPAYEADAILNVYNTSGVLILHNVTGSELQKQLAPGFYIVLVNDKSYKVQIK